MVCQVCFVNVHLASGQNVLLANLIFLTPKRWYLLKMCLKTGYHSVNLFDVSFLLKGWSFKFDHLSYCFSSSKLTTPRNSKAPISRPWWKEANTWLKSWPMPSKRLVPKGRNGPRKTALSWGAQLGRFFFHLEVEKKTWIFCNMCTGMPKWSRNHVIYYFDMFWCLTFYLQLQWNCCKNTVPNGSTSCRLHPRRSSIYHVAAQGPQYDTVFCFANVTRSWLWPRGFWMIAGCEEISVNSGASPKVFKL